MVELSRIQKIAIWFLKKFYPEQFSYFTVKYEGIYDLHIEKFLCATTNARREGGPLGWTTFPHGFSEEVIESLRDNRHLNGHVDNGLLLVPIISKTVRVKSSLITSNLIDRDNIPDFTNATEFRVSA